MSERTVGRGDEGEGIGKGKGRRRRRQGGVKGQVRFRDR
jgi:hypothetical protein